MQKFLQKVQNFSIISYKDFSFKFARDSPLNFSKVFFFLNSSNDFLGNQSNITFRDLSLNFSNVFFGNIFRNPSKDFSKNRLVDFFKNTTINFSNHYYKWYCKYLKKINDSSGMYTSGKSIPKISLVSFSIALTLTRNYCRFYA